MKGAFLLGLVGLLGLLSGCRTQPPIETTPPTGWSSEEARWWRTETDTTGLFRPLETLEEMGIVRTEDLIYATNIATARQSGVAHEQLVRAVKQSLIRLYRNHPEVVDSLFNRFVAPKVRRADLSGASLIAEHVEKYKLEGYRTLSRYFREPRTLKELGVDIPIAYPDSLRKKGINGTVRMQIYIDTKGEPVAIELLESLHPVLDAIVVRATTEVRWQPAYVLRGGKAPPVASWTRLKVHLRPPPG